MNELIRQFYYEFDINLRKGYTVFFLLAFSIMPGAYFLSKNFQTCVSLLCTEAEMAMLKNEVILFSLYVFFMIVIILGYVVKFFMIGATYPTPPEEEKQENNDQENQQNSNLNIENKFKEYENRINRNW